MKRIKQLFILLAGLLILGLLTFGIGYIVYNEPLPQGETGPEADALAEKMLKALNSKAYHNTRFLEWSYAGNTHHYKWDKANGRVEVRWSDYRVLLNLNDISKSQVFENGKRRNTVHSEDIYRTARDYFNNDSFWLVGPYKVFDTGVERGIVQLEDGSDALLVTYTQGGTTPGDSYLWKLNAQGFPESFQMWVKIIPIGGLSATWDDWKVCESGAFLPGSHKIGPITLSMGDVKGYH